jgi:hypothetical protein
MMWICIVSQWWPACRPVHQKSMDGQIDDASLSLSESTEFRSDRSDRTVYLAATRALSRDAYTDHGPPPSGAWWRAGGDRLQPRVRESDSIGPRASLFLPLESQEVDIFQKTKGLCHPILLFQKKEQYEII